MGSSPGRPSIGRSKSRLIGLGRQVVRAYGCATARWRPDPDFLIIGAKRGGSTSFYFDLLRHPAVCPLFPKPGLLPKAEMTKGIHYFDVNYFRGERWYRSHLPSEFAREWQARVARSRVVTGEASPYYLFHPASAERASQLVPRVRIIAVLRDPVMRTYSHWKERRRNDAEPLSLVDALAAEDDRIGDAEQRLVQDPTYYSYAHEQQSYARQSEYAVALERWYRMYPGNILVLSSEEYYEKPQAALDRATEFLGLRPANIASGAIRNAASGAILDANVRESLRARFAEHNERLERLTGQTFPWT